MIAQPDHASARRALERLGTVGGAPVVSSPATVGSGPRGLEDECLPSVYRFLLEDPTPISQQTVKLIQRVECEVRPRYVAFVGRYLGHTLRRMFQFGAALVIIAVVTSVVWASFPTVLPVSRSVVNLVELLLGVSICLLPLVSAAVGYVSVRCMRVRIAKGRLQIERGIFRKHLNNIDFWRVHNIDLDRRLVNRFTEDGTLVFY